MLEMMGETLRPGGFSLTEKWVRFCEISHEDAVLDLGCGRGATVNYLFVNHHINAVGIDPSVQLIEVAKEEYKEPDFFIGSGEDLPFSDDSFNCVIAECTLSLMEDLESTIEQVYRVLKEDGWFVITDVYAKNPDAVDKLNDFTLNSCMRGLHDLEKLEEKLKKKGFDIILSEDHSTLLKDLLVKIAFTYGSMGAFWNIASQDCMDGCKFQEALKLCKPGYFMMIARKGVINHG
jgi:ubiquinone/menaquinone biosynthesis C-methylase UbiE